MSPEELQSIGIKDVAQIVRNPSYEELYAFETDKSLEGFERCYETSLGALSVDTGSFTGRSAQDKYFVDEPSSRDHIWWAGPDAIGSDNKPMTQSAWDHIKGISANHLSGKPIYVIDGFAGANPDTRLSVRVVTDVAWQAHFCKNMFIRPDGDELDNFTPDFTILCASKAKCTDFADHGLRSEVFIAFHLAERMCCIGGTWYGGEMKKGIFSVMNYFLPLKGIGSFHCSANIGKEGDTALFFGLSGTGKTTLSTDKHRALIGDDEHGWDDNGVFNFEGGCYAKTIDLSEENEPEIHHAIRRGALLENVVIDENGVIDFHDDSKTQNTRVSYPIFHIDNIVTPRSIGGHPKNVIFLTCDAFGVLPPVARLTSDQALYQYLSGYTAKVAGTELGITEPKATFSACFGGPFLSLHPTVYAEVLGKKMKEHGSVAYLVNTGWTGGPYGKGQRMSLKATRAIIDSILDGSIQNAEFEPMPRFGFDIPKELAGIDSDLLHPRNTWADSAAYDAQLDKLAGMFRNNFNRFTDTDLGKSLADAGPTPE